MAEPSNNPYSLVVDDDAIILMNAAEILEEAGFRTLTAMNADEALGLLERNAGDVTLLFTDVEMPGSMNGFALAREVASRWPEIGILVASGRLRPKAGDLPEGATFIGKPFTINVVHQRIQEILPDGMKPEPLRSRS